MLDSGAVIAETSRSTTARAHLAFAFRDGLEVLVPAGVVAQTIRGGARDVLINRLLKRGTVTVTPHDEARARTAGMLMAKARDLADLASSHPQVEIKTV